MNKSKWDKLRSINTCSVNYVANEAFNKSLTKHEDLLTKMNNIPELSQFCLVRTITTFNERYGYITKKQFKDLKELFAKYNKKVNG